MFLLERPVPSSRVISRHFGSGEGGDAGAQVELSSNRAEDHELSMLALYLLQNCMVYINTLMLQQILARPPWPSRLSPRDLSALTPLIWEHVNPYGRFERDMTVRLPLD